MDPTHPADAVFGTKGKVRVLRILHRMGVPQNASQIARAAGMSKPSVAETLNQLSRMGLIDGSPVGRSFAYWLVRENVYVQGMVDPVFRTEEAVPDTLLEDLASRFSEDAISIVLFGSYARGDQTSSSDVDVVLVGADAAAKARLDETHFLEMEAFRARFGARLSAITYDADEARALEERSPAFLSSLMEDGVVVFGLAPWEWSGIG